MLGSSQTTAASTASTASNRSDHRRFGDGAGEAFFASTDRS